METRKSTGVLALRIMFFAMLIGMLMFSGIIYFISQNSTPIISETEVRKNIFLIALAVAAICLTVASFLMQKDIKAIGSLTDAKQKFEKYRSASIRTYALFEASALVAVIAYFLTQQPRLYIIVAMVVVRYLVEFPTSRKIAEKISESEDVVNSL